MVAEPEGRDPETLAEDMVRTRLHEGVPPEQIPLSVSNQTGLSVALVQRVVEEQLAVAAATEKRRRRGWWIVGVIGVLAGYGLDQLMGTSRGIGTALLVLAVTVSAIGVYWLVNQIRHL
jgi:hypothetical protein